MLIDNMFKRSTLIITNDIEKELSNISSQISIDDLRIIKPNLLYLILIQNNH